MLILMIATNDPAGSAYNLMHAINTTSEHRCRLVTTETRYNFLYRKDLHLPLLSQYDELEYLLKHADVFHFHMTTDEEIMLGPFHVRDYIRNKIIIHHHHGEPSFRDNPESFRKKEISLGRLALVSTPDLHLMYPESYWLPNTVPLNDILYTPSPVVRQKLVISHSPTKRFLKNTDEFIEVTKELLTEGHNVTTRIIELLPHELCLRAKRDSDICFDHMQGYYGLASLEALSQGVACIAGLSDHTIAMIKDFTNANDYPWIIAKDKPSLKQSIINLINNQDELAVRKKFSRQWMINHWRERLISAKYFSIISR